VTVTRRSAHLVALGLCATVFRLYSADDPPEQDRRDEAYYRLSLAAALAEGPAVVDLSAYGAKFTGGDVGIAPADVKELARDGDKLRGRLSCTLAEQACWFELDVTVRAGVAEGRYRGARGAAQVQGAVTGTVVTSAVPPSPANPRGWRGDGTGVFRFTDPPTVWEPPESSNGVKNVCWRTRFSGERDWGNAQPVLVGQRLFVFSEPTVMGCLNADTGAVLWQKDLNVLWALPREEFAKVWPLWEERNRCVVAAGRGDEAAQARWKELDTLLMPKVQLHGDGCQTRYLKGYGLATPVTDGTQIYVWNGSGVLAAVDLDGDVKWARNLGYNGNHSSASSPCLVDGRVLVWNAVSNTPPHTLAAYDAKTGAPLWQTEQRPVGDGAGCGSTVVLRLKGVALVVSPCGDIVRVADGRILAREVHPQGYNTPVVHDDVVFFAAKSGEVSALRVTLDGEAATCAKLWTVLPPNMTLTYASMVYLDGCLYLVKDRGTFLILNAATGETLRTIATAPPPPAPPWSAFYPSICAAGGKVYAFDDRGHCLVLRTGPSGEVLARNNDLLGPGVGSALFAGNRIYLRRSYKAKPHMPPWIYCLEVENKKGDVR
jgi:outer membrane protein assembly factor BamB